MIAMFLFACSASQGFNASDDMGDTGFYGNASDDSASGDDSGTAGEDTASPEQEESFKAPVRQRYEDLVAALPGVSVFYAVKANPHPDLVSMLVELGS
jgi:hypothetical protein